MREVPWIVAVMIYLPLFAQVTTSGRNGFVAVAYGSIAMGLGWTLLRLMRTGIRMGPVAPFVLVNSLYILLALAGSWGASGLVPILAGIHGFSLALGILLLLSTVRTPRLQELLDRLVVLVALAFLVQFAFSLLESSGGNYWGAQADWLNSRPYRDRLGNRFIGNVLVPGSGFWFPLSILDFPLTGLLGQHNYWGTQLPFYNLLFLLAFASRRRPRYLVLAGAVLAAALLNTTRFGIGAILITDMVFILKVERLPIRDARLLKGTAVLLAGIGTLALLPDLTQGWQAYFGLQNTLGARVSGYSVVASTFANWDLRTVLVGTAPTAKGFLGNVGSFESQLLSTLVLYGVLGLLGLFTFWGWHWVEARRRFRLQRWGMNLILLNMVLVSVISNFLFHYSTWALVMILTLYCRQTDWSSGPGSGRTPAQAPRLRPVAGSVAATQG